MSDLISRQVIFDALIEKGQNSKRYKLGENWELNLSEIIEAINAIPSAEPERKWIPITEALPEEEKRHYWICTDTGYQCQCRWTNDVYGFGASDRWNWKIFDIPQYQKIVAWMPLPEPWKGE